MDPAALPDVNSEMPIRSGFFAESVAELQSAAAEVSQDTSAREGVEFTILRIRFIRMCLNLRLELWRV